MKKITPQSCLAQEVVLQYLHERLSEEETYAVESHLMDCMECNEAIEYFACTHNAADNPAQLVSHVNAII